jgi:hypothetical protein
MQCVCPSKLTTSLPISTSEAASATALILAITVAAAAAAAAFSQDATRTCAVTRRRLAAPPTKTHGHRDAIDEMLNLTNRRMQQLVARGVCVVIAWPMRFALKYKHRARLPKR